MATRTVRLDAEDEAALKDLQRRTREPISAVLKAGLRALRDRLDERPEKTPYEIFEELDLGADNEAAASSTNVRGGVAAALTRKHRR